MVIGADNEITAADINAIILKINNEKTVRGVGGGALPDVVVGNEIMAAEHDSYRIMNDNIDAVHCNCEADPAYEGHQGGVTLVQTAPDVAVGDEIRATHWSTLDDDADALVAQCDCDNEQDLCNCDNVCTNQAQCSNNVNCTNDWNCTCDLDGKNSVCGSVYVCTNNTVCGCNTACTNEANCTCDKDCNCEWN